jgi:hypothetical protein
MAGIFTSKKKKQEIFCMENLIKELLEFSSNFNLNFYYRLRKISIILESFDFKYLGSGRHRFVFLSPNKRYVLKFPIDYDGLLANEEEEQVFKSSLTNLISDIKYAPCRLISNTILMMRYVEDIFYSRKITELPIWVNEIDSCQVGLTKDGKLVAYDFSNI